MKYLARVFVFNVFGLWLVSQLLPALVISGNWPVLVSAGFVLSLLMLLVAPILKILFIPVNILTFGLLSWVVNVIVIYLLTLLVAEVQIKPWTFPGFSWAGFIIPAMRLEYLPALVASSLLLTAITNILHDISEG